MKFLPVLFLFICSIVLAQNGQTDVEKYILEPSVLVKADYASGSGCILLHSEKADKPTCYVLTAGHVVDGLRSITEKLDKKDGRMRKSEKWKLASIVQLLYEKRKKVGKVEMDAEVVAYNKEEDLALLKMRKRGFVSCSIKLLPDDKPISIGEDVYHCGSRSGEVGANSLTDGIISALSRYEDDKEYHQTTAPASPGSSGGGIFLKESKEYIGMITMGAGETHVLFIPIARIKKWLGTTKYAFLVGLPVPKEPKDKTDAEASSDSKRKAMLDKGLRYWLYILDKESTPQQVLELVWPLK